MTAHPIDTVIVDNVPVSKSDVRAYTKSRIRQRFASPDEVRDTKLSGQYAGIYVRTLQANFDLDTSDTITEPDGVNCLIDDDGNRFFRVVNTAVETEKVITATGDVTIADDETADNILIDNTSGGPINVYWPSAAVRTKKLYVTDGAGNAGTYPITNLPKSGSGQTLMTGASYVLDVNGMGLALKPRADGTGWY